MDDRPWTACRTHSDEVLSQNTADLHCGTKRCGLCFLFCHSPLPTDTELILTYQSSRRESAAGSSKISSLRPLAVPPNTRRLQIVSAQLFFFLPSQTLRCYHHYTTKQVLFGLFVFLKEHPGSLGPRNIDIFFSVTLTQLQIHKCFQPK